MEKRIEDSVRQLLMKHPDAAWVEFKNDHGENDNSLLFDTLGFDIILHLHNGEKLPVQVKCGSYENFITWGKERQSFILGDYANITGHDYRRRQTKSCHYMLTGYEIEPGNFSQFALFSWALFLERFHKGKIPLNVESSKQKYRATGAAKQFCWTEHTNLSKAGLLIPWEGFTPYNISLF